jgi:hypothetical protein
VPQDSERKNAAIIVEEGFEIFVRATTLEHNFHVVFDFSLIWRGLLHIDHRAGVDERVFGEGLSRGQSDSFVVVEATSELISFNNAEDTGVNVNVAANREVTPGVGVGRGVWLGDKVALKEDTLRDARVLNAALDDVEGVILEVVEHDALADTVILVGVLDNGFLEVGVEFEHLKKTVGERRLKNIN